MCSRPCVTYYHYTFSEFADEVSGHCETEHVPLPGAWEYDDHEELAIRDALADLAKLASKWATAQSRRPGSDGRGS